MSGGKRRRARSIVKVPFSLLLPALFPICCSGVMLPSFKVAERQYDQPVTIEVPGSFPVMVFYEEDGQRQVRAVYYEDLEALTDTLDHFSYRVPDGAEEHLNQELAARSGAGQPPDKRFDPDLPYWSARFHVLSDDGERQALRTSLIWDDDRVNTGWYVATDDAIIPKKYRNYFGPGVAMMSAGIAFVITAMLWITGRAILRAAQRYRRRRSQCR